MPNEPLAIPEFLAGLPETADYDAVLAAIMATEGGRKFLTEFAERNRNTDTAMVVGAIARIEATLRGEAAPPASAGPGDLIEIAAALERISAVAAAGAAHTSETAAAVERMQDIAFMLHERPPQPALRDAFDAAVRELSATVARADAEAGVAGLLQTLANRVREMIEARMMSHQPAAALFAVPADNGEALAHAVAALTESLPTLGEMPAPASEAPTAGAEEKSELIQLQPAATEPVETVVAEPVAVEPVPTELPASEPPPVATAAPAAESEAAIIEPPQIEVVEQPIAETPAAEALAAETVAAEMLAAETTIVAVEEPVPATSDVFDSQAILSEAFADDHFASASVADDAPASEAQPSEPAAMPEAPRAEPPNEDVANAEAPRDEPSRTEPLDEQPLRQESASQEPATEVPASKESASEEPASEAALPAQEFTAEPVAGPEEDPADLFEPAAEPPETAAVEAPPPAADAPAPQPPEPALHAVPPPPPRAIPRPPLSDPLAAVRDLSEEELIALFS